MENVLDFSMLVAGPWFDKTHAPHHIEIFEDDLYVLHDEEPISETCKYLHSDAVMLSPTE